MENINAALNDLIGRVNDILAEEKFSDFMLERVFRMKDSLVSPLVELLKARPETLDAAKEIMGLYRALEEYVVCFQAEPQRRQFRRNKVEGIKAIVRRKLLGESDRESEVELLLDEIRKWQWKTSLDAAGRLVFATSDGKEVPPRAVIAEKVGPAVIQRAVKALRPYSERVRPRDIRGEPGGLVVLDDCRRAIVVGDLHGRYDNLENILKDKNNLEDIMAGQAHLVFTGDAVHPPSSLLSDPKVYEDSFCTMLLIMTLKAENPFNVHYLVGNHDHAHIGGRPAGRGEVRQDMLFEKYSIEKWGPEVFEAYRTFVAMSPVVIKARFQDGYVLMVHAGLTQRVLNPQGLINIKVKGPQGPELHELLWSRNYEDRDMMAQCLKNVGAKLMIVGHTPPTTRRANRYGLEIIAEPVFAHVHHLQVIINAQNNLFGYLDLDLTRDLPEDVTDLKAPDGKPAFRMLRPRRRAPSAAPPPEGAPPAP